MLHLKFSTVMSRARKTTIRKKQNNKKSGHFLTNIVLVNFFHKFILNIVCTIGQSAAPQIQMFLFCFVFCCAFFINLYLSYFCFNLLNHFFGIYIISGFCSSDNRPIETKDLMVILHKIAHVCPDLTSSQDTDTLKSFLFLYCHLWVGNFDIFCIH